MTKSSFYWLPIPTPVAVIRWLGKAIVVIFTLLFFTLFSPTWAYAEWTQKCTKGYFTKVAALFMLLLVLPLNLAAILSLGMAATAPSYEVSHVVKEGDRYVVNMIECQSSVKAWAADLVDSPMIKEIERTYLYDVSTDTWWEVHGVHANIIRSEDSWVIEGWSRPTLTNRLNDWLRENGQEDGLSRERSEVENSIEDDIENWLKDPKCDS